MHPLKDYQQMLSTLALSTGKLEVAFLTNGTLSWAIPNNLLIETLQGPLFFRSLWFRSLQVCFDLASQRVLPISAFEDAALQQTYQERFFCILEGNTDRERLILIADQLPVADKIRISAVRDIMPDMSTISAFCYQMVALDHHVYAIPDLRTIVDSGSVYGCQTGSKE